ncbi:MAG: cell division protein FtsW [Methylobacteriaceae bacterium]|nr:cell division protein FtsW [Methylobacteriaceae bacterium]
MVSRAVRSPFAAWWWTIDRWLLAGIGALIVVGLVLTMAGSPPVAERLGLPTFHFVHRQFFYLAPAIALMAATSFLSPRHVRRAALLVYVIAMALIFAALLFGVEVKGSRRWIFGVQPSEFLKPAFVVLAAWAFSEGAKRRGLPGNLVAMALLPMTIAPLVLQPDFGQTMLVSIVWASLFFMAGLHGLWVVGIGGAAAAGILGAYRFMPHVRGRITRFLDGGGSAGDTFQVDTALESFAAGGWLGRGPGEGRIKRILPDGHTDFIFAVTGEEFGLIACLMLAGLFCAIVLRGLWLANRSGDPFCRFAAAGLVMLFGLQSVINMAVNLHLMPAKGMTLPFISYGGSSLISLAIGMGFLIAVTRDRPRAESYAPPDKGWSAP